MSIAPPPFTPLVAELPPTMPFVPPEELERRNGRKFQARLGANENPFGPSPQVVEILREMAGEVWKYGDSESFALRAALSEHLGVEPAGIGIGEGIDGLMSLVCRLFLTPGETVVTSLGGYPTFNYHVAAQGARLVSVPYRDDFEDLQGLARTAREAGARIVYLSNPDNPMGTFWPAEAIEAFVAAVPSETLILLDEAYGETAPEGGLPPLDISRGNLLRLRTFSKVYGLAGLRVGYAIGDPTLVAGFDRIRNHFGVNIMAQAAAVAALKDRSHLQRTLARIAEARERIASIAEGLGLVAIPSATNFVAVDCGGDGAFARRVLEEMDARGVFLRKPMAPGLDRTIRVSAGLPEELDQAALALAESLEAAERPPRDC